MTVAIRNVLRPVSVLLCIALLGTQIAQAAPIVTAAPTLGESQPTLAPQTAAAPVPAEVRAAKKVFVESNASSGDRYNGFVAALKAWGVLHACRFAGERRCHLRNPRPRRDG
jgi:hypothetical protein